MSVAADVLREALGVQAATFLIADAAGRTLVDPVDPDGRFDLDGTDAGRAWTEQRTVHDGRGWSYTPVTVRGDALGVLAVQLPEGAADTDGQLAAVAHALGYVLIANQRHTDRYETAMRSVDVTLAREIQRRLLPPGLLLMTDVMFERSAASFDLPGALRDTADQHTRSVAQGISRIFLDTVGSDIQDDAALLLLEWHGGTTGRTTRRGADDQRERSTRP